MRPYIGSLPWSVTSNELRALFQRHGKVSDAMVVTSRETGRSEGFGFVTMPHTRQARAAIEQLDGYRLEGRPLRVNEALVRR